MLQFLKGVFMNNVLGNVASGSVVDLIVVILILFLTLIGLRQGFIARIVKVVGGLVSFILAVLFCKKFSLLLNSLFGLNKSVAKGIKGVFKNNEALNKPILSGEDVGAIMKEENVPSFIAKTVKNMNIQDGDTLSDLISRVIGGYISIAIAFIILIISIRLLCILFKFLFERIENSSVSLIFANKILGVAFGLVQGVFIVSIFFFIVGVLPNSILSGLHKAIDESKISRFMTEKNVFNFIFGKLLKF